MQGRMGFGFCLPGYRYCGPGCSGPGSPTNPVDACCKFHD
ncbi:MAG TPA: Parvovirus coat protein VP1-like protein, partial [Ureibacillus sp.]|nr:Parvovirus coat protein VP1-like protein [Ureibacillus sp.]